MIFFSRLNSRVSFRSSPVPAARTASAVEITPRRAGWRDVHFAVRHIAPGKPSKGDTGRVCEVFTPAGNWSSYPPHKHDVDRPPSEVSLEETYFYRFADSAAYGMQRLYDKRHDRTVTVGHGDVVLIRRGYHPFVTAYGYNAYYLNVLAGTRRSMAASDEPRYAGLRAWPAPDPRLPVVPPPIGVRRAGL
jgi:5-deoxy-glucuronate isomerase